MFLIKVYGWLAFEKFLKQYNIKAFRYDYYKFNIHQFKYRYVIYHNPKAKEGLTYNTFRSFSHERTKELQQLGYKTIGTIKS